MTKNLRQTKATRTTGGDSTSDQTASFPEDRFQQIAVAAYYRAERRGFAQGDELADWLEAEKEIDISPVGKTHD